MRRHNEKGCMPWKTAFRRGDIVPALSGLTHQQLRRPIAEAVAGEAVASFEITQEHVMPRNWLERWGGRRTYGIPCFCYKTKSGRTSKESVFVKRTVADFPWSEADACKWLGAANAPIPKGFGCLLGPNQEEILFMEHLCGTNGDEVAFFSDASNFHEFLTMSARFDAIAPPPEYSATLAGCKVELQDFEKWQPALRQIWEEAEQELLGADLKQLCSLDYLRAVEALADHTAGIIGEMPRGPGESGSSLEQHRASRNHE